MVSVLLTVVIVASCARGVAPPKRRGQADAAHEAPSVDVETGSEPYRLPGALERWGGGYFAPGAPVEAAKQFDVPTAVGGEPAIVYPLDGSMHAPNVADVSFQWQRGDQSNALFRIRLENLGGSVDFYVRCASERCSYVVDKRGWSAAAVANPDGVVSATVAGVDGNGGPVSVSEPIAIRFAPEPVRGGLYYWSTAFKGIYRLEVGDREARPFIAPGTAANPFECAGCHSISRNGKIIAFTVGGGIGALSTAKVDDPAARLVAPQANDATNASSLALSPDGSRVLVVYGKTLTLRDSGSGEIVLTVPEGNLNGYRPSFPEWSPDGNEVVLTLWPDRVGASEFVVVDGSIAVIQHNDGTFGNAEIIVPFGADSNFYPTFSPDGKWIAFASVSAASSQSGYNAPAARLRLVARAGGRVYELVNATGGQDMTSTWPKFTPFMQRGGTLMFLAFNSKRDYGNVLQHKTTPQLWMSAIDLARLDTGDPSLSPVWLPFQEPTQQNHLPFFTEVLVCSDEPRATAPSDCGDGRVCRDGVCQEGP